MNPNTKLLYVGAHQDDIFLGAGIKISRNPENVSVLTVSDGVSSVKYPWNANGMVFSCPKDYFLQRQREDIAAMSELGVDVSRNYHFGRIPDQQAYKNIGGIIHLITHVVENNGIEEIVTHSFPEAHPDHEIVWFCSNMVSKRKDIPISEFVTYRLDGEEYVRSFDGCTDMQSTEVIDLSDSEIDLQKRVAGIYLTQKKVLDKFLARREVIGKRKTFDPENLPDTTYYYRNRPGLPTPEDIRKAIIDYFNEDKHI